MQVCKQFIDIVEIVADVIITAIRAIIETVCRWITTFITTVVEVLKRVCPWVPWPLNKICKWITELVEVVSEVVDWVCEEVLVGFIIEFVERILVYIYWIVRWACWVIDWLLRFLDILFCFLGVSTPRQLDVCIKILTDESGNAATTRDRALEILVRANELLAQCNVRICVRSVEFIEQAGLMNGVSCGGLLFRKAFSWFEKTSCTGSPKPLTLFFVDTMSGTNACTFPRTSFTVLTDGANGASVVHEIGHHADLFHRDDRVNIMFVDPSDTKDKLTHWQCCMIRSSAFVNATTHCGRVRSLTTRIQAIHSAHRE